MLCLVCVLIDVGDIMHASMMNDVIVTDAATSQVCGEGDGEHVHGGVTVIY